MIILRDLLLSLKGILGSYRHSTGRCAKTAAQPLLLHFHQAYLLGMHEM
jgi:hypothetical protein